MARTTHHHQKTVDAVLDVHGRTFCDELGIDISSNTPSPLFRWLCASLLFSARIDAQLALSAARALADNGWTTPEKLADSSWEERTRTLNKSGYARYDESTSRMLEETADMLLDTYRGDLRVLRDVAEYEPAAERKRLKAFMGIGDVGVDIFFRETQGAWDELYPFADKKSLQAAESLGLPGNAEALADLVDRQDFPRLLTALVRANLEHDFGRIRDMAA